MARAPQSFEKPPKIIPPGIGIPGRRKGEVIPFPSPNPRDEREEREEKFRISKERILKQEAERAAVAPNAEESYEAYVKRLEGMEPKSHSGAVKINGPWWDDTAKKQRETWRFQSTEIDKENAEEAHIADYWITERNGMTVRKMVPGTLDDPKHSTKGRVA